ncbi:hypothetical protein NCC49_000046 [Naganishia albida]|nr:hypothetical protein NCC49_000046 [Naganishia albida]
MATTNATLLAAMDCTANSTDSAFATLFAGDRAEVASNIASFLFRICSLTLFVGLELYGMGYALIHAHRYLWPQHFDYFLNPPGVPRIFRRYKNPDEAVLNDCRNFVKLCNTGMCLVETPIMLLVFVTFLMLHFVVGCFIWYWIPVVRPTRLPYTAVCVGIECIKFAGPFVAFVGKPVVYGIASVLTWAISKIQKVAEREGTPTVYSSFYRADVPFMC